MAHRTHNLPIIPQLSKPGEDGDVFSDGDLVVSDSEAANDSSDRSRLA